MNTAGKTMVNALLYGLGAAAGAALWFVSVVVMAEVDAVEKSGVYAALTDLKSCTAYGWHVGTSAVWFCAWSGVVGCVCALVFRSCIAAVGKRGAFLLGVLANILNMLFWLVYTLLRTRERWSHNLPLWPYVCALLPCYPLMIAAVVACVLRKTRWSTLLFSFASFAVVVGLATALTAAMSRNGARRAAASSLVQIVSNWQVHVVRHANYVDMLELPHSAQAPPCIVGLAAHGCIAGMRMNRELRLHIHDDACSNEVHYTNYAKVSVVNVSQCKCSFGPAAPDIVRYIEELGMTVTASQTVSRIGVGRTFAVAPCITVCEIGFANGFSAGGWWVYLSVGSHAVLLFPAVTWDNPY